jgi:hypothetical protein
MHSAVATRLEPPPGASDSESCHWQLARPAKCHYIMMSPSRTRIEVGFNVVHTVT